MDTITISCRRFQNRIFSIAVRIGHEEYEHEWEHPHDPQTEALLEYYFEDYINKPYDDVVVQSAPEVIKQYGEDLYQGIFSSEAVRQIEAIKNKTQCVIEIVSDIPPFQALYWEAMKPVGSPSLAHQGVIFRRRNDLAPVAREQQAQVYPTINLLIVTCRPGEEHDVNQRTVQRPLVELLDNIDAKVDIHILRPGTYDAFLDHLSDRKGYYHIVHFDLHGALMDYDAYSKKHHFAVGRNRVLQPLLPKLSASAFGAGERGIVFFETQFKGIAAPVDALQLAEVLEEHRITVAILNACQSAKQDYMEHETSLAGILAKKGLDLVLAMRHSISVTAVQVFMKKLYDQLYQGVSFEPAIAAARCALMENTERHAMFNKSILLEDWILPVVYWNRETALNLRPFHLGEAELVSPEIPDRIRQNLSYGFVGRDLDILKIEKALLTQKNILLLQSMGGAGKTTLLKYLAAWWLKTGFVSRVFYFGYDIKGYFLEEILHDIARYVFPKETYDWYLQTGNYRETLEEDIVQFLNAHSCALILDNTEVITGEKLAVRNTLPTTERQKIKSFLTRLKSGRCFVLIGSRSAEEWLQDETFGNNHYVLKGLDQIAAMNLAESILTKNGLNVVDFSNDSHFEQLIKLLGGSPLALKAILPNLKKKTPKQILDELSAGIRDLDEGNIQQKTESIIHCIEYAYNNLSEDAQNILLYFAPFAGVINQYPGWIDSYFDQTSRKLIQISYTSLGKSSEEQKIFFPENFDFENVDRVLSEAKQNGLAQELIVRDAQIEAIQLQPVFAYFLRLKSEDQLEVTSHYLNRTYIAHIYKRSETYSEWINSDSPEQQRRGLAHIEMDYENLHRALMVQLQAKSRIFALVNAIDEYLKKKRQHAQRLELLKQVEAGLQEYKTDQLDEAAYLEHLFILDRLVEVFFEMHEYELSKRTLGLLAPVVEKCSLSKKEKAMLTASVHQRLGEIALRTGNLASAEVDTKKAFEIFQKHKFEQGEAATRRNLGVILLERGDLKKAEIHLVKALNIFQQTGAVSSQAELWQNIGSLYAKARLFDEAIQYYQNARDLFAEFDDNFQVAGVLVNLGNVFFDQAKYAEAREFYLQAIEIYEQYRERYHQANLFSYLGDIAHAQRQLETADGYYHKALAILIEHGDEFRKGQVLQSLGVLSMDRGIYETAFTCFQTSLSIFEKHPTPQYQARAYYNLGNFFAEKNGLNEAKEHYERAITLSRQAGDEHTEAMAHHNLGLILIKAKNFRSGITSLREALVLFEAQGDVFHQAITYERIGDVANELGEYEMAANGYLVAFMDWLRLEDEGESSNILKKIRILLEKADDIHLTQAINKELSEITSIYLSE